ncbi:MAG: glycosyl hydrolase 53 family protein [Ferruginibacter sp.]|nr:glycosyl hydrolase 53 family protein [Bacteroidota bacterium]MBX2919822.1 glycosyl hydrolase 53 family protein [Ferruginibacter sp.]
MKNTFLKIIHVKSISFIPVLAFWLTLYSCSKSGTSLNPTPPPTPTTFFAKGADVSWLTEMENAGIKFYNSSGVQTECMQLLKNTGVNSIRLRVWVNPAAGWNNTADVITKALRAKNLGLKIMIDFHYSDSWADPGQQTKPAAWAGQDVAALQTSVYNHTYAVMDALKTNGITPEWVQVGNETNDGMLWPQGKASVNMANYAKFFIAGYNAVKAISATTKVIVHLSNGYDNNLYRWNLDGLKANGAKWDVIGMSLYPTAANWVTLNNQCLANMNDMVTRYGSEIMICEIGMSWDEPTACNAFISDLIGKVKSLGGNKGLGVFYWEPEAYNNWQGYTLGAFDNSGKPTSALQAFN